MLVKVKGIIGHTGFGGAGVGNGGGGGEFYEPGIASFVCEGGFCACV